NQRTHTRCINPYLSCSTKRDRPPGRSLFVCANMPCLKCAPVAQRIEHLPCWSLNGECGRNPLSGRPCMRGRPESLRYLWTTPVQVKSLEDWVIRRKPLAHFVTGILRDYTGRDCDVQDIVQPATPAFERAVRESL